MAGKPIKAGQKILSKVKTTAIRPGDIGIILEKDTQTKILYWCLFESNSERKILLSPRDFNIVEEYINNNELQKMAK